VAAPRAAVGEFIVRFRRVEGMSNLDSWQELVQRSPPPDETPHEAAAPSSDETAGGGSRLGGGDGEDGGGDGGGNPPLRYHCSSTHPHFANLLQLILLSHGFGRSTSLHASDWSLLWYAGQIDPTKLRALKPFQLCSKFPNSGCLTTKSQLWATFERMQRKHGEAHFGFVASSFILPEQVCSLVTSLRRYVATSLHRYVVTSLPSCLSTDPCFSRRPSGAGGRPQRVYADRGEGRSSREGE
jgi:hypothetical protein